MQLKAYQWRLINGVLATGCGFASAAIAPVSAQLIPDPTLGTERSVVVPDVPLGNDGIELIEGGATRGNNLFHSFLEFNVGTGQQVYFANPAAIETVVTRVTGTSSSNILGTLGVLGNANLFLINPHGIVFGPEAAIDVRGSFLASTAERLVFENGYAFSTLNPDSPPLLTVNAPVGLTAWLPHQGNIAASANLVAGEHLTLTAESLTIQGNLQAGASLNILANNQLQISDTAAHATTLIAEGTVHLQGSQALTLDLLNHPNSGIQAGGNLALRSDTPVLADASFVAGGNLTVTRLDGSLGRVISPQDPVFEVAGDFEIADFTGGSLQILAGGSVNIPGTVFIEAAGGPFNDGTVVLSNGETLALTGTAVPTLDVRAGTTEFFASPEAGPPTSANISIGTIVVPGGVVFLTNQFAPNPDLVGDIDVGVIQTADLNGGGDVVLDSRGQVSFQLMEVSGQDLSTFETAGNAGAITVLAAADIVMPFPSGIFSFGLAGGAITLESQTAIIQADAPFGTNPFILSTINSVSLGDAPGGEIRFAAPSISIGGNVITSTVGPGQGGDLILVADALDTNQASLVTQTSGVGNSGNISIAADVINLDFSAIATSAFPIPGIVDVADVQGNSGNIRIQGDTLTAIQGAQIGSSSAGVGNAGNVTVEVGEITLSGFQPGALTQPVPDLFFPSGISSSVQPTGTGEGGRIDITTNRLSILDGADIGTSTFGNGNAGAITINASEAVTVDGAVFVDFATFQDSQPSGISSEVFTGAAGNGGNITLNTPVLQVTNGGTITSQSDGDGNAGTISITATEAVLFNGVADFSGVDQVDRISGATVAALTASTGSGGGLSITAPVISIRNGAQISAANTGTGEAGNLNFQGDTLQLDQGTITAETVSGDGGNIDLDINDLVLLTEGSRISTTAGTAQAGGDGGNIAIETPFLIASPETGNSDITANAFSGQGGTVTIVADGIFGLLPRSRPALETLLNTSDPVALDPVNLPTNDITAISQVNPDLQGSITIVSPDLDPSQGAVILPSGVIDTSRLIAQGCASGGAIAQEIGSLIVTGRGGLPADPSRQLSSDPPLLDWATVTTTLPEPEASPMGAAGSVAPAVDAPRQIQEVQSLVIGSDGQVILSAEATHPVAAGPWLPLLTCAGNVP